MPVRRYKTQEQIYRQRLRNLAHARAVKRAMHGGARRRVYRRRVVGGAHVRRRVVHHHVHRRLPSAYSMLGGRRRVHRRRHHQGGNPLAGIIAAHGILQSVKPVTNAIKIGEALGIGDRFGKWADSNPFGRALKSAAKFAQEKLGYGRVHRVGGRRRRVHRRLY